MARRRRERCARELSLGDKAARAAFGNQRAEITGVATRSEDHHCKTTARQRGGDLKTVQVGQVDVEEDYIGRETLCLKQRRAPIAGLTDDLVAIGLKQLPRTPAKGGVVIDNENRLLHGSIVRSVPTFMSGLAHTMELS